MRPRNRRLVWLFVVLFVISGSYALFFHGEDTSQQAVAAGKQAAPTPPPPAVEVAEVHVGEIPLQFEYSGRTAGSREVEIRARVSGILQERRYTEGEWVKKGSVLFVIDPEPFKASLGQSQARYTQAQQDWKRAQTLFKEKAISPREYDEARAAYEQSRAAAQTDKINLGYTTVVAPISGYTSKESLSEGSLIAADSSLLTRISQLDPIYVDFAYPDTEALSLRQQVADGTLTMPEDGKLGAEIRFGNGTVYNQEGVINFTDSIIDPQTGSVRARAVLPNPDGSVLPGQFVRVIVKGFTKMNAASIPDTAIMQGPQGPFVYGVGADGNAAVLPVKLGAMNGKERLIESGLKTGDRVITAGMIKVRPGAPVTISQPQQATAATAAVAPAAGKAAQNPAAADEAKPATK
jgi:membrane fusion protein (multidrug efflux system)